MLDWPAMYNAMMLVNEVKVLVIVKKEKNK